MNFQIGNNGLRQSLTVGDPIAEGRIPVKDTYIGSDIYGILVRKLACFIYSDTVDRDIGETA